jgi:hypothetical protein
LPKITLLRDGKPLTAKDGIEQTFDAVNHRLVMTVKNARVEQTGLITCRLENPIGSAEESFNLNVSAAPVISKGLTDQECLLGNELRLVMVSSASPLPTVKWLKDNIEVTHSTTKINDDTYELVISNVKTDDEGIYKVIVSNELGDKESQCKLTVIEPADLQCQFPEQQTIEVGQVIHLQCHINGRPMPDVIWTKDGKELKASDRIEITKTDDGACSMTIKNATSDDKVISLSIVSHMSTFLFSSCTFI